MIEWLEREQALNWWDGAPISEVECSLCPAGEWSRSIKRRPLVMVWSDARWHLLVEHGVKLRRPECPSGTTHVTIRHVV